MDLSLEEIKEILSYNDLNKIINSLTNALNRASNKINDLNIAINKINRAKNYYENKLKESTTSNKMFIQQFNERVIILSKTMSTPSLENLFNYLEPFYKQLPINLKDKFSFKGLVGI